MLQQILNTFGILPDYWGEGALFAFSGLDGPTNSQLGETSSDLVATYGSARYSLIFHTAQRRFLDIELQEQGDLRIATGDVIAADTRYGALIVTYSAWHSMIGLLPKGAKIRIYGDMGEAQKEDEFTISAGEGEVFALLQSETRFALAYGKTADEARERATTAMAKDFYTEVNARLRIYGEIPTFAQQYRDRFYKKCISVMRVNTLSAEGIFKQRWSTPDRLSQREIVFQDAVFQAIGMNQFFPDVAWEFLQSIFDTQREDGMIPQRTSPSGERTSLTHPPILAWGVWDNYTFSKNRSSLEYALPRLENYLNWILANRDGNSNNLLEWVVEGDGICTESAMENSPRFDSSKALDAVDFSALAAMEMNYLAMMARELGDNQRANGWQKRSRQTSEAIHRDLWQSDFYFDVDTHGLPSSVRAVSGFYPVLLDDITPARLDALSQQLHTQGVFNTAFPIPSVALTDPSWSTDMWRGGVWLSANWLVVQGFFRHNRNKDAVWLLRKCYDLAQKYYKQFGILFEFYDSEDQVPPTSCDRKGRRTQNDPRRRTEILYDNNTTAALSVYLMIQYSDLLIRSDTKAESKAESSS